MFFEESNYIYLLCYSLMYVLMFWGGIKINQSKGKISLWWIVPFLAYGLNVGLRFGRGTDYIMYMNSFPSFVDGSYPGEELGWFFICHFIGGICNLPWPALVLIMSFFMILAGCIFLRNHKKVLCYALPLFAYYSFQSENLARWYLAASFVLIAISLLENKRSIVKSALLLIIGVLIHYGIILAIIPIVGILILKRSSVLCSTKIAIISMLIIYILFSPDIIGRFVNIFDLINIGGRFDLYMNDLDTWTKDTGEYGLSLTDAIIYIIFIYKGSQIVRQNNNLIPYYNIALLGTILSPALRMLELSSRICHILVFPQFLIFAYIFEKDFSSKNSKRTPLLSIIVILLMLKIFVLNGLSLLPEESMYLWDVGFNLNVDI